MEEVDFERVAAGDQHVQPEVEFESVDEVGAPVVTLDDLALSHLDVVETACNEYALALAGGLWFDDHADDLLLLDVVSEVIDLVGEVPRLRGDLVLVGKELLHLLDVLGKAVLPTQLVHGREVVDLLVRLHLLQLLVAHGEV